MLLVGICITVIKHRIILGYFHSIASGRQDQDLNNSYCRLYISVKSSGLRSGAFCHQPRGSWKRTTLIIIIFNETTVAHPGPNCCVNWWMVTSSEVPVPNTLQTKPAGGGVWCPGTKQVSSLLCRHSARAMRLRHSIRIVWLKKINTGSRFESWRREMMNSELRWFGKKLALLT